jgi:hypothetical protein
MIPGDRPVPLFLHKVGKGGLQDVFSGVIESYLISDPVSLDVAYDDLVDVSENLLPDLSLMVQEKSFMGVSPPWLLVR